MPGPCVWNNKPSPGPSHVELKAHVRVLGDRYWTPVRRGSCTFFFLYFFLKWGYFFFLVGYFFLTFFLLSLTFERQEKAGKDRKRSKKERAREKAGIAPPARPRRACEGACPPYTCVALPHPPLSPAVCLHARCPTRDCLTMRATSFHPSGGGCCQIKRRLDAPRTHANMCGLGTPRGRAQGVHQAREGLRRGGAGLCGRCAACPCPCSPQARAR